MAEQDNRTASTRAADANRARMQGLGAGQSEMDAQRDPNRHQTATSPEQRSFDGDLDGATGADRPKAADFEAAGPEGAPATGGAPDRNAAGLSDVAGDLGAGTPANVDLHKLGQEDKPQSDWGDPADPGTVFSSNHTRRGVRTEGERGQGRKTRRANKDIVSRRS